MRLSALIDAAEQVARVWLRLHERYDVTLARVDVRPRLQSREFWDPKMLSRDYRQCLPVLIPEYAATPLHRPLARHLHEPSVLAPVAIREPDRRRRPALRPRRLERRHLWFDDSYCDHLTLL